MVVSGQREDIKVEEIDKKDGGEEKNVPIFGVNVFLPDGFKFKITNGKKVICSNV